MDKSLEQQVETNIFKEREYTVVINCPIAQVFEFVANFENLPCWNSSMLSSTYTWRESNLVGATFTVTSNLMGKHFCSNCLVMECEPNIRISWLSTSGPLKFSISLELKELATNITQVTYQVQRKILGGLFNEISPTLYQVMHFNTESGLASFATVHFLTASAH